MSQATDVMLKFPCRTPGKGTPVEFTNVEEFFETLGILCRGDGSTVIKGNTNTDTKRLPPGAEHAHDGYEAGLIAILNKGNIPYKQTSFFIECADNLYYTKTFHDIFQEKGEFKISCSSYVCYLFNEGYAEETVISGKSNSDVVSLKASHPEVVRAKMREKGLERYVYFFNKGLATPKLGEEV